MEEQNSNRVVTCRQLVVPKRIKKMEDCPNFSEVHDWHLGVNPNCVAKSKCIRKCMINQKARYLSIRSAIYMRLSTINTWTYDLLYEMTIFRRTNTSRIQKTATRRSTGYKEECCRIIYHHSYTFALQKPLKAKHGISHHRNVKTG